MVRGGLAEHADRLVLIGLCRRGETVRARVRQSTLNGMLLAPQHLRTADEAARPTLNPWAAARATILALCDGAHTVRDIEQAVYDRHRALFNELAPAQVFVAEVLSRYGAPPERSAH